MSGPAAASPDSCKEQPGNDSHWRNTGASYREDFNTVSNLLKAVSSLLKDYSLCSCRLSTESGEATSHSQTIILG